MKKNVEYVIARSESDEAIQLDHFGSGWIASLHFVTLAMTVRNRDLFLRS